MSQINWQKVREEFERDLAAKLRNLPGHREVPENLKEFRGIISHELPETASRELFQKLIGILLEGKLVEVEKMRKQFLEPELKREKAILDKFSKEFSGLRVSAKKWVRENLSEEELQAQWKAHQTKLPRRYTIYENPNLPFQEIAIDTLARYALITNKTAKQTSSFGLN